MQEEHLKVAIILKVICTLIEVFFLLPCYVHIITQFKKDTDHLYLSLLYLLMLNSFHCHLLFFPKVHFLSCLFIIVCNILAFPFNHRCSKSRHLKTKENKIPLCTARACQRQKRITSAFNMLWLKALFVFYLFVLLL